MIIVQAYCMLYTPDLEEGHTENEPLKFKSYIPMYVGLGCT